METKHRSTDHDEIRTRNLLTAPSLNTTIVDPSIAFSNRSRSASSLSIHLRTYSGSAPLLAHACRGGRFPRDARRRRRDELEGRSIALASIKLNLFQSSSSHWAPDWCWSRSCKLCRRKEASGTPRVEGSPPGPPERAGGRAGSYRPRTPVLAARYVIDRLGHMWRRLARTLPRPRNGLPEPCRGIHNPTQHETQQRHSAEHKRTLKVALWGAFW